MKAEIENTTFGAALRRALRITSGKSNIPILGNVLLEADCDGVTVYASNLDQGIKIRVASDINEPGKLCVPAKRLSDIVGQSSGSIEIETDGENAQLVSGRFRATIQGLNPEEFPWSDLKDEQSFRVEGPIFAEGIHKTIYAASTDETRYILNGLLFESHEGAGIRVVGTDGRQLAAYDLEAESVGDFNFVLPTLACDIAQSIAHETGVVQVSIGQTHFRIVGDDVEMWSKVIEGKYPDYRAVFPDASQMRHVGDIPREPVKAALRRVSLVVDPKLSSVHVTGSATGILLEVRNNSETATETVECEAGDFTISINPAYLSSMLGSLSEEYISVQVIDEMSPMLIEVKGLQYIIMPMRKA